MEAEIRFILMKTYNGIAITTRRWVEKANVRSMIKTLNYETEQVEESALAMVEAQKEKQ